MGGGRKTTGNDEFTVLLCHFDNNSADSSIKTPKGNGTIAGPGFYQPSIVKFGSHSFGNSANAYMTFPNHADYEFGAGNFTIDWWEYRTAGGCALARDLNQTYSPWLLSFGAGRQIYMSSSTAAGWDIASAKTFGPVTNNVWAHL